MEDAIAGGRERGRGWRFVRVREEGVGVESGWVLSMGTERWERSGAGEEETMVTANGEGEG